MTKMPTRPFAAALGAAVLATAIAPAVGAETNPFAASPLASGYDIANFGAHGGKGDGEGKCGEGKCGEKGDKADKEGKCGEGKCGN